MESQSGFVSREALLEIKLASVQKELSYARQLHEVTVGAMSAKHQNELLTLRYEQLQAEANKKREAELESLNQKRCSLLAAIEKALPSAMNLCNRTTVSNS